MTKAVKHHSFFFEPPKPKNENPPFFFPASPAEEAEVWPVVNWVVKIKTVSGGWYDDGRWKVMTKGLVSHQSRVWRFDVMTYRVDNGWWELLKV